MPDAWRPRSYATSRSRRGARLQRVGPLSAAPESGIARPSTGTQRRTPVGASYDAFGSERYVLTFDNRALSRRRRWAPYEFISILVNSHTYGGGGIYGAFATVAVDNDWADYLFVHEFGHHFAALADELLHLAGGPTRRSRRSWNPGSRTSPPCSRDMPAQWRDLVKRGTPVPTPWPKDEFEARQPQSSRPGARRSARRNRPESEMSALFREEQAYTTQLFRSARYAHSTGAFRARTTTHAAYYRSQLDCVMFTRNEVPFCRVCQRALEQVIDLYAGPRRGEEA